MTGRFYGVGLGPGDPELVTLKAARLIASADVIAYHAGVGKESNARRIAASLIPAGVVEEELRYPVTTGATDHPGGYAGAMAEFYEESAARLAVHLEAGRTVVLLAEGDPLFYGSFMYMHDRLAPRFPTEVVPGVPAFTAATAAAGLAAGAADRRAHGAARHAARAGARPPARGHRRRDHHEARPHLPRRTFGAGAGRPAGARDVRRARVDARPSAGCRWPTSTRRRCRTSR